MNIRNYTVEDKATCLSIFESNCPLFFDKAEYVLFENWLNHQANTSNEYKSPTYTNTEHDAFYVLEHPEHGIIACGGFYIVREINEARFAWGMVHANFHKQGYGTLLYKHRLNAIKTGWPNHKLSLGTSQHTYAFYAKMGMKVIETIKAGYGADLDRYDMEQ
jgi:N-acetylglutamate synthase-like GNAT family acetyltransferase